MFSKFRINTQKYKATEIEIHKSCVNVSVGTLIFDMHIVYQQLIIKNSSRYEFIISLHKKSSIVSRIHRESELLSLMSIYIVQHR